MSDDELLYCWELAKKRNSAKSVKNRFKKSWSNIDNNEIHYLGVLGEMAYSKWFGLPINEEIYYLGDAGADFEDGSEIKTSTVSPRKIAELKVTYSEYKKDFKKKYINQYILAHIDKSRKIDRVNLLGFIDKDRFDIIKQKKQYTKKGPINWVCQQSDLIPILD